MNEKASPVAAEREVRARRPALRMGNSSVADAQYLPAQARPRERGGEQRLAALAVLAMLLALAPVSGIAQGHHKVPVVNRQEGSTQQAFNGIVKSLDTKMKVLSVNRTHSEDVEMFPMKKGIHVTTLAGKKIKLGALVPGDNVLIYYDEKGGERTVKQVIVLENATAGGKQAVPAPGGSKHPS